MYISVLNKHNVFHNLGQFFEFVQSIVDIGNLFHCFNLFCSEEANLNVGTFVKIVLLDRGTNLPSIVSCYVKHFFTAVKLLIHSWLFARNEFQHSNESKVFSILNNLISNCRDCFSFFFTEINFMPFMSCPNSFFLNSWKQRSKWYFGTKQISQFLFDFSKTQHIWNSVLSWVRFSIAEQTDQMKKTRKNELLRLKENRSKQYETFI